MIAKQKKNKRGSYQTLIFSVFLGLLFFGIVGSLIVADWRTNKKRAELNLQLGTLQRELQDLEEQRQSLQAQISQVADESYLEEEAREKFNLKKPGEEVVTILPAEDEEVKQIETGFWGKMWEKLKFW